MNLVSRAWQLAVELWIKRNGLVLATVAAASGSAMGQNGSCCSSGVCVVSTHAACSSPSTWTTGFSCSPNPCQSVGPDIIVCGFPDVSNNGTQSINGIVYDSFAVGTTSANKGSAPVSWLASADNRHPAIAQNLFRYIPSQNRFEQLGQGALKHGFTALQDQDCAFPNYFNFGCTPTAGTTLGVGCADPYCCGLNNNLGGMGPKWEVNAATGVFHSPYSNTYVGNSGPPRARLTDLQQAPADTQYFMEGQYIVSDDAVATTAGVSNKDNNATWQQVTMTPNPVSAPQASATDFNIALSGMPHREQCAIYAWKAMDSSVFITTYDVPDDGRFIIAVKVSGTGPYTYEYALHNMNSDRCGGSFLVPLPGAQAALSNIGFHDVEAVSEPNSLSLANAANPAADDWSQSGGSMNDTSVSWGGVSYAGTPAIRSIGASAPFTPGTGNDHSANVLRWGSMFNFRFTSDLAPGSAGSVAVGLWRPGTGTAIVINNVPTPGGAIVGTLTATCCNAGVCSVMNQTACAGTWGLPGTACSPDPCALGTCCDTGNCTVSTSGPCSGTGVWSIGGTCSPNTCPVPMGACCPGSTCGLTTQAGCPSGYQGHNTSCVSGPCPPANNACSGAIWVGSGTPINGSNNHATTDGSASCVTNSLDVWHKFRPTTGGSVSFNLCGSSFDTVLSIHTGTCGSLAEVACNDDSYGGGNNACGGTYQSGITMNVTANTLYYIRIAGYQGATGSYTLAVTGGNGVIPTGACCVASACSAVVEASCTGVYQGDGSSCTPSPCVTPGVCCRGATCTTTMTADTACASSVAAGSTTHGAWTTLGSTCNASNNATTPCCYADYNKTGGITVGDIFDYLNDWFAGYKYAVVGGDGAHGTLSVQNIFDFLGVWFAGGC